MLPDPASREGGVGGGGFWQGPGYEPGIGWPFGDPEQLEVLRCLTWFWEELRVMLGVQRLDGRFVEDTFSECGKI